MSHSGFSILTPCVDATNSGDKHQRAAWFKNYSESASLSCVHCHHRRDEFAVWCSHWVPSAPNHMKICLSFGNLIYECVKTHDRNNIEMPVLLLLIVTRFDCCKCGERDGAIPMSKNSAEYTQAKKNILAASEKITRNNNARSTIKDNDIQRADCWLVFESNYANSSSDDC